MEAIGWRVFTPLCLESKVPFLKKFSNVDNKKEKKKKTYLIGVCVAKRTNDKNTSGKL